MEVFWASDLGMFFALLQRLMPLVGLILKSQKAGIFIISIFIFAFDFQRVAASQLNCAVSLNDLYLEKTNAPSKITYSTHATEGDRKVGELVDILYSRGQILNDGIAELSSAQMSELASRALRLEKLGDAGEPTHIGDHQAAFASSAIAAALKKSNLSQARLNLLVLIHDLGKSYPTKMAALLAAPDSEVSSAEKTKLKEFRQALEKAFPDLQKDFLAREILAHEFGSMMLLEILGRQSGLSFQQIRKLQAEIAGHNAGYDLDDDVAKHFYRDTWPIFIEGLAKAGFKIPASYSHYPRILNKDEGGSPYSVVLTANDRLASLSLSFIKKISTAWKGINKFTNSQAAQECLNIAGVSPREADSVMNQMASYVGRENAEDLRDALNEIHKEERIQLEKLGKNLALMAEENPKNQYSDRPVWTSAQQADSIVYKTESTSIWYRVTKEGEVFRGSGKHWVKDEALSEKFNGQSASNILFNGIIFEDLGYSENTLALPQALGGAGQAIADLPSRPHWQDSPRLNAGLNLVRSLRLKSQISVEDRAALKSASESFGEEQLSLDREKLKKYGRLSIPISAEIPAEIRGRIKGQIYMIELHQNLELIRAEKANQALGSEFARDSKDYIGTHPGMSLNSDVNPSEAEKFYRVQFRAGDKLYFGSSSEQIGSTPESILLGGHSIFVFDAKASGRSIDVSRQVDEGGDLLRVTKKLLSTSGSPLSGKLLDLQKKIRDAKNLRELDNPSEVIGQLLIEVSELPTESREHSSALNDIEYLYQEIRQKSLRFRMSEIERIYAEAFAANGQKAISNAQVKAQIDGLLKELVAPKDVLSENANADEKAAAQTSIENFVKAYLRRAYPLVNVEDLLVSAPSTPALSGAKVYLIRVKSTGAFIGALKLIGGANALSEYVNSALAERTLQRELGVHPEFDIAGTQAAARLSDGRYLQFTRAAPGRDLKQVFKSGKSQEIFDSFEKAGEALGSLYSRTRTYEALAVGSDAFKEAMGSLERNSKKIKEWLASPDFRDLETKPENASQINRIRTQIKEAETYIEKVKSHPHLLTRSITHGDAHPGNLFYQTSLNEVPPITFIDNSGITRSMSSLKDPAGDIGRFLGSFYLEAAKQDKSYEEVKKWEDTFLKGLYQKFEPRDRALFEEGIRFYKLSFMRNLFGEDPKFDQRMLNYLTAEAPVKSRVSLVTP